jgi:capsular polysaccharide biosynthesis protein
MSRPNTDGLPSNKAGSLARLGKLVQKLEKRPELCQQYHKIIKEQEILEKATQEPQGKEFYLAHKPVC